MKFIYVLFTCSGYIDEEKEMLGVYSNIKNAEEAKKMFTKNPKRCYGFACGGYLEIEKMELNKTVLIP